MRIIIKILTFAYFFLEVLLDDMIIVDHGLLLKDTFLELFLSDIWKFIPVLIAIQLAGLGVLNVKVSDEVMKLFQPLRIDLVVLITDFAALHVMLLHRII